MHNVRIGVLASHSALDIADGAFDEGIETVAICEKGREKTYLKYKRIIKQTIVLDKFKQLLRENVQQNLRDLNVVFVPNRAFTYYIPFEKIKKDFNVPIFGNKEMLKTEDRDYQLDLFITSGIQYPKKFNDYKDIDRLCVVKVQNIINRERSFFICSSPNEFIEKWKIRENKGLLSKNQFDSRSYWIEEYIIGAYFNFNYFYSPLNKELEFLGIDRRIQTNIDGILKLPAEEQISRKLISQNVEIGHESATIRESMLEKVYEIGEKFVAGSQIRYSPGIIGPFALQGVVTPDLQIIIYDLSPRIPGSPVLYSSPYSKYYFGYNVTTGRRIAMEIKAAIMTNDIDKIVT